MLISDGRSAPGERRHPAATGDDQGWRFEADGNAARKRDLWRTMFAGTPGCDAFRPQDWSRFEADIRCLLLGSANLLHIRASAWSWAIPPQEAAARPSGSFFLLLCRSGCVTVWLEGASGVTAGAGQSLVLDTGRVWRMETAGVTACLMLPLDSGEMDTELTTAIDGAPVVLNPRLGMVAILHTLLVRTYDALSSLAIGEPEAVALHSQLTRLTAEALVLTVGARSFLSPHLARMVARARIVVARQAANPAFGPAQLAADLGVTPRYLTTLFQMLGCRPAAYIRQIRLHLAWDRLTDPDETAPIKRVAALSGFGDAAQFATAVTKAFGFSPRQIRQGRRASKPAVDETASPSQTAT